MTRPVAHAVLVDRVLRDEAGGLRAEPGEPGAEMDDRLVRAIGIPAFGLVIPHVTSLFAGVEAASSTFWIGTLWFLTLSAAIWHGNRWLLLAQRRHVGWFDHPIRKIVMLLAAIILFTAPLTIMMLAGWYVFRGLEPAWPAIQVVVLVNVICVVFVTHVYETVFLIKERLDDRVRVAELDRARARAELAAFHAQVDPHFLFNSLNTLGHLIATQPERAAVFNEHLAELHRYLLRHRGRALVPLAEELAFLADYTALLAVRFGDALAVELVGAPRDALVPPGALQLLVENAVKHNEVGEGHRLTVRVELTLDAVIVSNARRPRRTMRPSAGAGLANLSERIRLTSGQRIDVVERDGVFSVTVPLQEAV